MNKIRIVFLQELMTVIRSRSFLLTLILIPLVGFIVILVISGLQKNNQATAITDFLTPSQETVIPGVVDHSGIIKSIPDEMAPYIKLFPDFQSAQKGVEDGIITEFYVIPQDYLSVGKIEVYREDFNPLSGSEKSYTLISLLEQNLLKDDPVLLARIQQPVQLEANYTSDVPVRDPNSQLTFFLPYGITMLFYMLILGASSTMLNSITKEKQNRVMEMLLTSMTPSQMLGGKILALVTIGLFQTVVWTASGFFLLRLSGRTFSLPVEFTIPASVFIWGIVFFLLGYAMFASLMAGVGAMVPNLREGSQATFIIILPLIVPLFFINTLIGQPNGDLSMVLSLFPLTSPVAMMTRLAATNVPFWQPLLAAILQIATAYLIVRAVSGMFRAQTLLTGQSFKFKLFVQALLGKA